MTMHRKAILLSLALVLSYAVPAFASAATVYIDPATAQQNLGSTFIATVRIDPQGSCINAATVELSYPTASLRAVDFSRGESVLSLWVGDPSIDTAAGTVTFTGGIPGGYCGRIQGDSAQSNVLGKIIFTVVGDTDKSAAIRILPATRVYLSDGQGTPAPLTTADAHVTIGGAVSTSSNPWLDQIASDKTPPEPFTIFLESTATVFGGDYYIVFSTVDKQSGLDHYEIMQDGNWRRVESPYKLPDQSLLSLRGLELRAVDKAGNTRLGDFSATSTPPRQLAPTDVGSYVMAFILVLFVAVIVLVVRRYHEQMKPPAPPAQTP